MARILLVDDEPYMTRVMQSWLAQHGHEVTRADNGLDALDVLDRDTVDLLVTDVGMPELDGIGLIKALQGRTHPRAIIVLTGRHDYEEIAARHQDKCIRCLPKPFSPRGLIALIQELLAMATARASG
jgi:DNA-binding response OmpR family regulator